MTNEPPKSQGTQPRGVNRPQSERSESPAGDTERAAAGDAEASAEGREMPEPSRDLVFDALQNSRRRHVLRHLHERHERVTVNDLVEQVAAIENDTTPSSLTSDQRKRVYVGLYQCHLPKLDDMGLVEFDQEGGYVTLTPAGDTLDRYLDVDEGEAIERIEADEATERHETEDGIESGEAGRPWYWHHVAFLAVSGLVLTACLAVGAVGIVGAVATLGGIAMGVAGIAAFEAYGRDQS